MCRGTPEKCGIIGYYRIYSPFIVHRTVHHAEPANDHNGNATGCYGDPSTCAHHVYQALSPPPPLEGPGNEAKKQHPHFHTLSDLSFIPSPFEQGEKGPGTYGTHMHQLPQ